MIVLLKRRLRPDCPAEPINHLHRIRDGEGNDPSAESVPVYLDDIWIYSKQYEFMRVSLHMNDIDYIDL